MLCPACQATLSMTDRQGVEIDYCPKCRGVWLDRGELGKLIERSAVRMDSTHDQGDRQVFEDEDDHRDRRDASHGQGKPKTRQSWLSRILDFD